VVNKYIKKLPLATILLAVMSQSMANAPELQMQENLHEQQQSDAAIEQAREHLKNTNNHADRILLARLLPWDKNYKEARALIQVVLVADPSNYDATQTLVDMELWKGNYAYAASLIKDALKYHSNDVALREKKELAQAKLLAADGRYQEAYEHAKNYLKKSDTPGMHVYLGNLLLTKHQYEPARKEFLYVLSNNQSYTPASDGLVRLEMAIGNYSAALQAINQGLRYAPNHKILLYYNDQVINQLNSGEAATSASNDVTVAPVSYSELDNIERLNQRESANLLAENYLKQVRTPDSSAPHPTHSSIEPQSVTYEQLQYMAHHGDRAKAKDLAEHALKKDENGDIRVLLGLMNSWDGEYDLAREQFQIVLNKNPGNSDALVGLANAELWSDHYKDALRVADAGLIYHPDNKELLVIKQKAEHERDFPTMTTRKKIPADLGPSAPEKKMNAVYADQDFTYVDDLKQNWSTSTAGYERYTPYGPILLTYVHYYKFDQAGDQYLIEAYPHLFEGAYLYVGYGYSSTSYIAKNYIGFEPFFSLPYAFEISLGERILQFSDSTTHLYTGSFGKYWGNYWLSLRPYYTEPSSYSGNLTLRRYFSTENSYISITVGGGTGPSNVDIKDKESISSDRAYSMRLDGEYPFTKNFIFNWVVGYSYEHFPNENTRGSSDIDLGFIYRF
jgi:YaiO family outer membrane protein